MQFISVWNTSLPGLRHLYYLYIQLIYIFVEQFRNRVIYSSRVSPLHTINLLSLSIKLFFIFSCILFCFLCRLSTVHFDQCLCICYNFFHPHAIIYLMHFGFSRMFRACS